MAREQRDEARRLLAQGIDPSLHRKVTKAMQAERAANCFEAIAREWHAKMAPTWAEANAVRILRRLELYVFPWIGDRPIAELAAPEVLAVVRRIESRGTLETAHRQIWLCGQVFR